MVSPFLVFSLTWLDEPGMRIAVLPLGPVGHAQIRAVKDGIQREYRAQVVLLKARPLPKETYYPPRQRYRADRLLRFLNREAKGFDKTIAVTQSDISTTHRGYFDWGVVGLGELGGHASVVSSFRLRKKGSLSPLERLRRSATHEVGHTFGLPHCPTKLCVMRDAEGKVKVMDSAGAKLCRPCRQKLNPELLR